MLAKILLVIVAIGFNVLCIQGLLALYPGEKMSEFGATLACIIVATYPLQAMWLIKRFGGK